MSTLTDLIRLGRQPYRPVWEMQQRVQDRLITAKRSDSPQALAHTVLVVEHEPVFTVGKSGNRANLLASPQQLAEQGAELVEVDRGGDITFHGPGQTVVYPILDLDRLATPDGQPLRDLHRYLRQLEQAVIDTCADWDVVADRVPGRTGVWVGLPTSPGTGSARDVERKVCAMGVRCSRWVTMHGLALNVTTDLDWFGQIVPCGIDDRGVTSLEVEAGRPVTMAAVTESLLGHLAHHLGLALRERPASPEILAALAT